MLSKIKNLAIKNTVSAAIILVVGYILFNVAFLLASLVVTGINFIIRLTIDIQPPTIYSLVFFVLLLLVASYFVFTSKLSDLIKATFLTMPLMSLLILLGVLLYKQPNYIPIIIGLIIILTLARFFYSNNMSWMYYFAAFYVGILAFYVILTGINI